ncbi:MAG: hypothetical protein JST43_02015 [Bacteroidetes bacterium]|nr:hypothetical protein [Bacteroidota bacterium]MBS1539433.1 hypothetical protein [Bacteroidota bacterium]
MDYTGDKILTVLVVDAIGMCHLAKLVVGVGFANANYLSHVVRGGIKNACLFVVRHALR